MLIRRTRRYRYRKPAGPQEVDPLHPLAEGLQFFIPVNEGGGFTCHDAGPYQRHMTFNNVSPTWKNGPNGPYAAKGAGAFVGSYEFADAGVTKQCLFTRMRWRTNTGSDRTVAMVDIAGVNRNINFGYLWGGSGTVRSSVSGEWNAKVLYGAASLDWVSAAQNYFPNTSGIDDTQDLYVDGALSTVTVRTDLNVNLFNRFYFTNNYDDVDLFAYWHRALEPEELKILRDRPFELLKPRTSKIYISAATSTTLDPMALTGQGILDAGQATQTHLAAPAAVTASGLLPGLDLIPALILAPADLDAPALLPALTAEQGHMVLPVGLAAFALMEPGLPAQTHQAATADTAGAASMAAIEALQDHQAAPAALAAEVAALASLEAFFLSLGAIVSPTLHSLTPHRSASTKTPERVAQSHTPARATTFIEQP